MPSIPERRNYPRLTLNHVTVEVSDPVSSLSSREFCPILNISETGMLFRSEHQYNVREKLQLTFVLPVRDIIIKSDAIVIHSEPSGDYIDHGVQFSNLASAEQKLLHDFVKNNAG